MAAKKDDQKPVRKSTFTKQELVDKIARQLGWVQEDVATVVQLTLEGVVDALADDRPVEFRGFGVFKVGTRGQRVGRNPKKPTESFIIPKRKIISFKPGKWMRDMLGNK